MIKKKKLVAWAKKNLWLLILVSYSSMSLIAALSFGLWNTDDLEVYYQAAQRMVSGEEIYNIAIDNDGHRHFIYKYSPTALFLFLPFLLIPYQIAKVVYWIGLTVLIAVCLKKFFKLIIQEMPENTKIHTNIILFALLTILIHIDTELHLGQINIWLLALYIFTIESMLSGKNGLVGLFLAISIFIKPFGLIFIPFLILKRKYKSLMYFVLFFIMLFALPIIFYPSIDSFLALQKAWFHELAVELGRKQDLFADANHTIFSVLARFTPLKFVLINETFQRIYQIVVLLLLGIAFLVFDRKNKSELASVSVLIIFMPLFAFTSKNAFLFAMPLAMYLLAFFKKQNLIYKILVVAGCMLVGGNIYELYGPEYSMLYTELSLYSIGSICLLIAVFLLKSIEPNKKVKPIEASGV